MPSTPSPGLGLGEAVHRSSTIAGGHPAQPARHSMDIDVFFNATDADVDDAIDSLRAALRIDLGDHFDFDITQTTPLQEEAKRTRVRVNVRLGPTSFASFHIDVVVGTAMTDTPDVVAPLAYRPVGQNAR